MSAATTFYDFEPLSSAGEKVPLANYKGKVVLIVNTASNCGFTKQYHSLESVYQEVKKDYPGDFEVLGFPCNQFGAQEPGSNAEIQDFCTLRKVTFPIMSKIDVKGDNADPLYNWLRTERGGFLGKLGMDMIKWNFEKFLIGRDGQVKGRWSSLTDPMSLMPDILKELEKQAA